MNIQRHLLHALSWLALSLQCAHSAEPQLVVALAEARASGCAANAGKASALRSSPALDEAARRIARGQDAMQAARSAGYRATRIFHANFSGYASSAAVAQAMQQRYCSALADPGMREAGAHREGNTWWVVLAAPYDVPGLTDAQAVARRVLALTNQARAQPRRCGAREFGAAAPLAGSALIERAAQAHANDMAANDYVEHRGSDGSKPSERLTRTGYRWRDVGENIAAGQTSPEEVVRDWLKSPEHCASIMEPAFTEMGSAFAVNMQGSAVIYWTQLFARPR